jgi:membrane protease YdiL (CAAX protease family)
MPNPTITPGPSAIRRRTIRNLIVFITAVLLSGWAGRAVDLLAVDTTTGETPGLLIWIAVPLVLSLFLRAFAGDGWRDLGIAPRFGGNARWYLLSVAVYPAVTLLILATGRSLGSISFDGFSRDALLGGALFALAPMFFKNIFEELAWRGYLTPKLASIGMDGLGGHTIVGLVWGLWHLPYFLFFLDPSLLRSYTSMSLPLFIGLALLSMISWALVYGELRLLTGSVWPAVLMHMVEDAFLNELLLEGHIRIAPGMEWLLSPGAGLLNTALFTALGVALYRRRKRGERVGM